MENQKLAIQRQLLERIDSLLKGLDLPMTDQQRESIVTQIVGLSNTYSTLVFAEPVEPFKE